MAVLPIVSRARQHGARTAVVDSSGTHRYDELLDLSSHVASALLGGRRDLQEERIAFLVAPGLAWVTVQWAIWRAGGIAVPLPIGSPPSELEYYLADTHASVLIFDKDNEGRISSIRGQAQLNAISYEELIASPPQDLPEIAEHRRAMILYTSGTSGRPKGVVTTHANIAAQIECLVNAWEWSSDDRILLCLPLHHVHGIINVVSCALWLGATCEMLPRFDAPTVWDRIVGSQLTMFMAVPTIYVKLIAAWEASSAECRATLSKHAAQLRLMVSGSAALPVSTLQRWHEITGHTLLERYGMTEIGMALSNPYRGARIPGTVGRPLPTVEVRLTDEAGNDVSPGMPGEIIVRGPGVFQEYWGRPEATREAFRDGWFLTGDTAIVENGVYRILGRTNIDILKTGGHKVSALEIEEALREHPVISECAVVGIPDAEWGERIAAAVVLKSGSALDLQTLRVWARERLATHKIPSRLLLLESLPRNRMGKVTKPEVRAMFEKTAENAQG